MLNILKKIFRYYYISLNTTGIENIMTTCNSPISPTLAQLLKVFTERKIKSRGKATFQCDPDRNPYQ